MLAASLLLHALLLLPAKVKLANPPQQHKVIHAQLQAEQPKYTQLQQQTEPSAPAQPNTAKEQPAKQTVPPKVIASKAAKKESIVQKKTTAKPQPVEKFKEPAMEQPKQTGLAIQQDELALDPLERTYEQELLAHLRSKLSAPEHLNGQVRLAIKFKYQQIATEVKIIASSGNAEVDDWAIKSVLAANPFPPEPADLRKDYTFRPTLKIAP